ncbi:MAG: DUF480 domain-containing protein [Proteobacteria bacterium]|nr:DUF480 domain-containing protein [Pseudomonadota bacterium]
MTIENTPSENNHDAYFEAVEARVIACLMEKQLTTPNNYPLTMNSLLLACNQKSNRNPVMNLTEGQLGHVVNQLETRKLVGVDYAGRANHITHRVMKELKIDRKQQAILAVLMVREPITLNDIKAKTSRMEQFEDINELNEIIVTMINKESPLLVRIPKASGSREDRYTHLLCGEVDIESMTHAQAVSKPAKNTQLIELENRVESLEAKVEKLMQLLV